MHFSGDAAGLGAGPRPGRPEAEIRIALGQGFSDGIGIIDQIVARHPERGNGTRRCEGCEFADKFRRIEMDTQRRMFDGEFFEDQPAAVGR